MHISIKLCLEFYTTSRSIHVVLIEFEYIFVSFRILVYFVALRILVYFVSLRFVSHLTYFVASFRFVRCVSISFRSLVQPLDFMNENDFKTVDVGKTFINAYVSRMFHN